jgi:SAM-dependent methyltransferase
MSDPRPNPEPPAILETVARYYSEKVTRFGATAQGADWNSAASQRLRFDQLLTLDAAPANRSIVDYGCGYGALLDYLDDTGRGWVYAGYDVAEPMIACARERHASRSRGRFTTSAADLAPSDYVVASGIFNVRLGHSADRWLDYVFGVLDDMNRLARRGMAFNLLSTYSDPERRRDDLFYGDPSFFFDRCMQRFSARVALLHDYPLYEFTIVVRK